MGREKVKVYTYTRVSTTMQIDGYSLDAQKARMKAFADYNEYEIAGEYEDAGKSGKSIEGRADFNRMMDDIKSNKDGVAFVLVFKLSRFGRNAADVLSTLQIMQDFGVNLICVEDGIDSSKDAGKLMISVLSAVAEIERENIRVQTMEGRIQKAREGRWNGGFAPYGYQLVSGNLEINEEEAVAIRVIFEQYVNTDIGANGIAKYLENHGIKKMQRQNGKNPLFDAHLIRLILKNPVYCGKIAYGRRRTEKVHGTRNEYQLVEQDNYLIVDGKHDAIVSDDVWQAAQVKLLSQAKKYEHVNKGKEEHTHLLSGIVKCPVCGAGMYGNKSIKRKKDGTKYKDFYYYGCKHRSMTRGHKCDYKKQIREELLDDAVTEVIVKLVSNSKFAAMMQKKIDRKVDTTAIEQEIDNYEKQLRQNYSVKSKLIEEIDALDPDDKHYIRRKADLDERLYKMYDKIEETENLMIAARAKKQAIEAEKLTGDNIYKVLIYFDKLYRAMNEVERRQIMEALITEIQIYEERQENGQWLKSMKFKLPIIEQDIEIGLDDDKHVESVVLMSKNDKLVKNGSGWQMIGLKRGTVKLVSHEKEWEFEAQRTISRLYKILGSVAKNIQHVGSTSILTIKAKPIIDIAVAVEDFKDVLALETELKDDGFYYRPNADLREQLLFACGNYYEGTGDLQTHFIHVVLTNSMEWINYINFRDYLNKMPKVAKQYEDLKISLEEAIPVDKGREQYLKGKHDFIVHTLRKALVNYYLGKTVKIKIDRSIGSRHPKHEDMIYPVNYGYIPGVLSGDGEELDVYLLGVNEPVKEYKACIIGIVHRRNDIEDKLIAAPEGVRFTITEIEKMIHFQEQYYEIEIEIL